jgi:hypothetical protein
LRGESVEAAPVTPHSHPLDASLAAKISALLAEGASGDAEFSKAETSSAGSLKSGRGAPQGSEAWVGAEQARSALEVARQRTAAALGEIDDLVIAQAEANTTDSSKGGLSELQAAQSVIEAMVNRQTRRIEAVTR